MSDNNDNNSRTLNPESDRLTPAQIAERFGRMQRENERKVARAKRKAAQHAEAAEVRAYQAKLREEGSAKVGPNVGEKLREAVKKGARFHGPRGRFLSVKKVG